MHLMDGFAGGVDDGEADVILCLGGAGEKAAGIAGAKVNVLSLPAGGDFPDLFRCARAPAEADDDDADAVCFGVAAPDGFEEHFRGGVPVTRAGRILDADGQFSRHALPPVHLPAAGQDQPAHAAQPGRLPHVANTPYVVRQKFRRKIVVVGRGGQVNQRSHPDGGSVQIPGPGDVADDTILQAGGGDDVEPANGQLAALQFGDDGPTDAAGGADDQNGVTGVHCSGYFTDATLDSFARHEGKIIDGRHFGRELVAFARQDAILSDLEGDLLAVGETLVSVFLLGDAGPDEETAGQLQFHPQHDAQEIGVAQHGAITIGLDVGGNLDGVGAEADAQALAVGETVGREFQLVEAGDTVLDLEFEHVHDADEAGDELVGGLFVDFAGGADLFQVAAGEDDDAIGDLHGLLLVVGDEQGGDVQVVVQGDQPFAEFLPDLGIHGAEGFVEEQHAGFGGQGAGDGDALALAAGELVGVTAFEFLQGKQLDALLRARADFGAFPFLDPETEGDVLEHGHVLEQGVILEHETDMP